MDSYSVMQRIHLPSPVLKKKVKKKRVGSDGAAGGRTNGSSGEVKWQDGLRRTVGRLERNLGTKR